LSEDVHEPPSRPISGVQSGLRLDELLREVQQRLAEVVATRGRMQGLLDAVLAVADGVELDTTLQRIVQAAVNLVDARFGALGVLAPDGSISRFIYVGLDEATRARMGTLPEGKGLLGQVILGGQPLRLRDLGEPEKNGGGEFTADDEVVVAALATAAGIAVHNADLFEQGRLRQQWLEASAEIRNELLAGASEEDALGLIAQRAQELTRSDATVIALGSGELDAGFTVRAHCAAEEPGLSGSVFDLQDPLAQEAVNGRVGVLAESPGGLLARVGVELPSYGPTVAAPVHSQGKVIGLLVALRTRGADAFRPGDVPLLASFAEQVTLALELGEKNRAARQLDIFADRDRIARDLHDQVIQRLFATGLQLQSVLRRSSDPDTQGRVRQAVEDLDETVREIRTAIFDLHATGADEATSLRRLLLDTAAEAAQGCGLVPSVRLAGAIDTLVPPQIGVHALAVVREAVSNAVRHAGAERVIVTVEADDDLLIDIVDNGIGIDPTVADCATWMSGPRSAVVSWSFAASRAVARG
jgi:GAF domain-containing protein